MVNSLSSGQRLPMECRRRREVTVALNNGATARLATLSCLFYVVFSFFPLEYNNVMLILHFFVIFCYVIRQERFTVLITSHYVTIHHNNYASV